MIWDECTDVTIITRDTLPILWNPGTRAKGNKYADRWEVEVVILTADFGKLGPTRQYPWGLNMRGSGRREAVFFQVPGQSGTVREYRKGNRIFRKEKSLYWQSAEGSSSESLGYVLTFSGWFSIRRNDRAIVS